MLKLNRLTHDVIFFEFLTYTRESCRGLDYSTYYLNTISDNSFHFMFIFYSFITTIELTINCNVVEYKLAPPHKTLRVNKNPLSLNNSNICIGKLCYTETGQESY